MRDTEHIVIRGGWLQRLDGQPVTDGQLQEWSEACSAALERAMRRSPTISCPNPHLGGWTRTSWNPDTGAVEITSIDASEIYL